MSDVLNTFDSSDAIAVKAAVKTAKHKEAVRAEALRGIMSTEGGRAWMYSLLLKAPIGSNPYVSDSNRTAFNCGELNVIQQVVAELHACSTELYLQMMKENSND